MFKIMPSLSILCLMSISACGQQQVSFNAQVKPILEKNCYQCHTQGGEGEQKSGFNVSSHESLLRGTKFGPVITPGQSIASTLVVLIEDRADPAIRMPHGENASLSKQEIKTIRDWIDQGAKNN